MTRISSRIGAGVALALVLAAAAGLRGLGLTWGDGFLLHPDERFLALVQGSLEAVDSFSAYLDTTRSSLNPNNRGHPFFVYGLLPLLTVRAVAYGLGDFLAQGIAGGNPALAVTLAGRVVSLVADLAALLLLFSAGRRLYGRAAALLAAALYAAAALPIQLSHFATADAYANAFVALTFWAAVRMREAPRWSDEALLGAAAAAAAACKLGLAPVFLLGPLAVLLRLLEPRRSAEAAGGRGWIRAAAGMNVALLVALLVFRLAQPYAFQPARSHQGAPGDRGAVLADLLDVDLNPAWLGQMMQLRRQLAGEVDLPPLWQWAGRASLPYAWLQSVRYGLGWPLGVAAWLGWVWACARALRRRGDWTRDALPVVWVGLVFLWNGTRLAVPMRYFSPAYPALVLLGARLVTQIPDALARIGCRPRSAGRVAAALGAAVIVGTYAWALAVAGIYGRPHTRVAASRWIYENVPRGATIATEGLWDDDLPLALPGRVEPERAHRMAALEMSREDTAEKRARLQEVLDAADYVVVSSNRFYGSMPRMPLRFPLSIEYYRALFDGRLGFALAAEFVSPPTLLGLEADDGEADESFTVYDHPRVLVFRKTPAYEPARTARILAAVDLDGIRRERPADIHGAAAPVEPPPRLH